MKTLKKALNDHRLDIYKAFKDDLNKSEFEVDASELSMCIMEIDYFLKHLKSLSKRKKVGTNLLNFPSKNFSFSKGIKIGTMGVKKFKSSFKKIADDRYIESDFQINYDSNPDTDVNLCKNGFISIVPLQLEQTAHDFVNKLKNIVKK